MSPLSPPLISPGCSPYLPRGGSAVGKKRYEVPLSQPPRQSGHDLPPERLGLRRRAALLGFGEGGQGGLDVVGELGRGGTGGRVGVDVSAIPHLDDGREVVVRVALATVVGARIPPRLDDHPLDVGAVPRGFMAEPV